MTVFFTDKAFAGTMIYSFYVHMYIRGRKRSVYGGIG